MSSLKDNESFSISLILLRAKIRKQERIELYSREVILEKQQTWEMGWSCTRLTLKMGSMGNSSIINFNPQLRRNLQRILKCIDEDYTIDATVKLKIELVRL